MVAVATLVPCSSAIAIAPAPSAPAIIVALVLALATVTLAAFALPARVSPLAVVMAITVAAAAVITVGIAGIMAPGVITLGCTAIARNFLSDCSGSASSTSGPLGFFFAFLAARGASGPARLLLFPGGRRVTLGRKIGRAHV